MFDPLEGFRSPRPTYEDPGRVETADIGVDGPARVNSLDVDARSDEHAVKNDIVGD